MLRKHTFPATLVIALVIIASSVSHGADPTLVGWWPLDDGTGTIAFDASENGNDGTLQGDAQWALGMRGGAIELDGTGDYVDCGAGDPLNLTDQVTIACWTKVRTFTKSWQTIVGKGDNYQLERNEQDNVVNFYIGTPGRRTGPGVTSVNDGEWHHVAGTYDGTAMKLYVDGNLDMEAPITGPLSPDADPVFMGENPQWTNRHFDGWIDDVRIYSRALTVDEILIVMESGGEGFPLALRPVPEDGATLEATWANLSWRPGSFAVSHDLYFGTSFDDVNDGSAGTFAGNLGLSFQVVGFPGFPAPDGLQPGTNYYWRVDEVNDADPNSPWKGNVWSFWVPPKKAYEPEPGDAATFVDPEPTLGWTPGFGAKLHHVYFGDNADAVATAAGGLPQQETNYTPGTLETDKTYYWRVDEFDGLTTHKGDVWSFTTLPTIGIHSDPDLIAWWTFDEGEGAIALDWSGHGNHATLVGSEWITPAALGDTALRIGNYGAIQNLSYAASDLTAVTVASWVRTSRSTDQYIISFDRDNYWRLEIDGSGGGPGQVGWDVMTSAGQVDYGSITRVDDGLWHHIAGVFDNGRLTIYIDGVAEPSATGGATFGSGNTRFGFIGANSEATGYDGARGGGSPISGEVDDIRIYHRALTQEEIVLVMRGDPRLAWAPSPADGSTPDVDSATPLSWSAGDDASSHEVYFGTDADAVENSDTSDTTGVYRGRQNGTSFTPSDGVEWGAGPFYWRVDENNADGTVTRGRVWTFTVSDFLLVDNFESYTDNDAANEGIWQHWIDGFDTQANGSQVGNLLPPYAEQTIVHGGTQSMPLIYSNTAGVKNSEAVLTLATPRDWTRHGVSVLSLWFRGYPPSVGSFTEGPAGAFTMTGSGADIWGAADQFHFAYKTMTGPGTIVARVDSLENTNAWAKAGVMIRETLDADSRNAFVFVTPENGVTSQGRTDTGAASFSTNQAGITTPHWVRLQRDVAGNFTASHSANGSTWEPVGGSVPTNVPMVSTVYVGLALTSHNAAEVTEARFSNVTITGSASAQWTNQDIGILGNDAEPLYVALSNSAGAAAVVVHDDAGASVTGVWTQWTIDLSKFADQGVNLTDVDKIAIGLGTKGDPTATGGSGKVFLDDITLRKPAP